MKKEVYLIFFLIILFSCKKNKEDLKLELLTNEIVCIGNVSKNDFLEVFYVPNSKYDSLSKNILHYKITNLSNKKYFVMLNQDNLGTVERDLYQEAIGREKYNKNEIGFSLYKNDSALDGSSTITENMCGNDFELMKIEELEDIVDKFLIENRINKRYRVEYLNLINDTLQGYYLQPGETKYFTSIINLPYRKDQKWFSNIDTKKPNLGSLSLQNDSIITKRRISKDDRNNIKENGYILFNGIIYSNKVPVRLINIQN